MITEKENLIAMLVMAACIIGIPILFLWAHNGREENMPKRQTQRDPYDFMDKTSSLIEIAKHTREIVRYIRTIKPQDVQK